MEVDTSCLQNLTTQKSFFSIPCHQSSILSYQLTSCINSEDEKQQHKEKEIRSIDGKGMGFWKTEKTNEIKSECLYLRLEQQAELKTPQISWRLQGLIISSQETNLNIKTISHTISLWNNCSEEIEFRHQKGLEMDVQMCYLSQLYKVLFILSHVGDSVIDI
ncbi:hypothetical protein YC2023_022763 [Brassica napus]